MIMKLTVYAPSVAFAFTLSIAAGLGSTPAQAGFLDELFGSFGTPTPQAPTAPEGFGPPEARPLPSENRRHKKKVFVEEKPVRQQPTDLMHDKTLQVGDAVMMKDGLHIYQGPEADTHNKRQFKPIDAVRHMPAKQRATLLALDTTRNDPLRRASNPDTIASGRSAAVGVPVTEGIRVTDTHGKSIRYVGP